jgi:pyruvate formate lyase activating enzyme
MDVKASAENYSLVAGARVDLKNIRRSIKMIIKGSIPYEFRTTLAPAFFDKNELKRTGEMIEGAGSWYLQKFILADDMIDEKVKERGSFTDAQMEEFRKIGGRYTKNCFFR